MVHQSLGQGRRSFVERFYSLADFAMIMARQRLRQFGGRMADGLLLLGSRQALYLSRSCQGLVCGSPHALSLVDGLGVVAVFNILLGEKDLLVDDALHVLVRVAVCWVSPRR